MDEQGESLRLHALYDALDQHFCKDAKTNWGWHSWPEKYQNPRNKQVQQFAAEHARQIEYFMYLQWLAATQLQTAQQAARDADMQLGLYGDVAVGGWMPTDQKCGHIVMCTSATFPWGAPPDPLALKGQDWGIPPQQPTELRSRLMRPSFACCAPTCARRVRYGWIM